MEEAGISFIVFLDQDCKAKNNFRDRSGGRLLIAIFLSALAKTDLANHSSDYPYFRLPTRKIHGVIVDEELRNNWELHTQGDEANLEKILKQVETVDIFHYDSDKSYRGRVNAYEKIKNKLTSKSLLVFDDIQDNSHFADLCRELDSDSKYFVFKSQNKFVGLIGTRQYLAELNLCTGNK